MRLSAALALLLTLPAFTATAQSPEEPRPRGPVVSAEGSAEVRVAPDRASVVLGVREQAPAAKAAQDGVNRTMKAILDGMRKAGVPTNRISTSRVDLHPVYSHSPNRQEEPKVIGFRASNSITVLLHLDEKVTVGQVLDAAMAAGANSIDGVHFSLADDTAQRAKALEQAAQNARSKAEAMARSLGLSLGDLVFAREAGAGGQPPRPMMRTMATMEYAGDAGAQVQPGELAISASVHVTYRVK